MARTKEPQYERTLEVSETAGVAKLGLMTNQTWHDDPKRLLFVLARYKFVAKLFQGYDSVLEVGCADAFGTRIIRQHVPAVTAIDFDPVFVEDVQARMSDSWPFSCFVHDILQGPVPGAFQGAYSLDVIEHIDKKNEELFMSNISDSLRSGGALIIGTPSIQSQSYASPSSKEGHINCKNAEELKSLALRFFHNAFIFSMNDEVVHTGFYPMAQYLMLLATGKKR